MRLWNVSWRRRLGYAGLLLVGLFVVAQAVPYGRSHHNPPTTAEPSWDSAQTRALAKRACFDCHSNLTTWPLYSNVAPVSWLVQRDVDGGRSQFNFSEWNKPQDISAGDLAETIRGGSMPPWFYTIPHPGAKLTKAEQDALINGLVATLRRSPPLGGGSG
jgi:mono/diheme cytochrome c family protein